MDKLLTVSIAAYNVEQYLEQTLSSLNDRRFAEEVEVLIIDDGSKDHTKDIALKYQEMAPNTFKYIAKENGGHGSTINKGIELATGKYFKVVDGDDWVDTDQFAIYIEKLRSTDTDLILTPYKTSCNGKENIVGLQTAITPNKIYMWDEAKKLAQIVMASITVRTEALQNNATAITENCYYVDIEYNIYTILYTQRMVYWDIPIYIYRINTSTQSVNKKNMVENIAMQEKVAYKVVSIYKDFQDKNNISDYKRQAIFKQISQSVGATFRTYFLLADKKEAKKRIAKFDQEIKLISKDAYNQLENVLFIRVLRFKQYFFVSLLRDLYRVWILKY